jgi:hypothetical protein
LKKVAGLADEIKGDIGNGDILFEGWAVAAPFTVSVAEDKGVIGQVEGIFK